MSYQDRFRNAFSEVTEGWGTSLPFCNGDNEFLFFYKTGKTADGIRYFASINKIWIYEISSGILMEQDAMEATQKAVELGTELAAGLTGSEALKARKQYLAAYEEFFNHRNNSDANGNSMQDEICSQRIATMKDCFEQLIPPSALRRAYFAVCPEFFEKIGVTQN